MGRNWGVRLCAGGGDLEGAAVEVVFVEDGLAGEAEVGEGGEDVGAGHPSGGGVAAAPEAGEIGAVGVGVLVEGVGEAALLDFVGGAVGDGAVEVGAVKIGVVNHGPQENRAGAGGEALDEADGVGEMVEKAAGEGDVTGGVVGLEERDGVTVEQAQVAQAEEFFGDEAF